jgi:hypothetical protein
MVLYKKMDIVDGKLVEVCSKEIPQEELTSECWGIQFQGLTACEDCEFLDTDECGGVRIRELLLQEARE